MKTITNILVAAFIANAPATALAGGGCSSFLGVSLCHISESAAAGRASQNDGRSESARARKQVEREAKKPEKAAAKKAREAERAQKQA